MANPTSILAALSNAPANLENSFGISRKPTAFFRDGPRLSMTWDAPADPALTGELRGAILDALKGCEFYYAETDDEGGIIFEAGDSWHAGAVVVDESPAFPDARTHVFVSSTDLRDDELASLCEEFNVYAVYKKGDATLVHLTTDEYGHVQDGHGEYLGFALEWPELHRWACDVGYAIEDRNGFDSDDDAQSPFVWMSVSRDGEMHDGDSGDHPLWDAFGMQFKRSFAVTFDQA